MVVPLPDLLNDIASTPKIWLRVRKGVREREKERGKGKKREREGFMESKRRFVFDENWFPMSTHIRISPVTVYEKNIFSEKGKDCSDTVENTNIG